MTTIMTAAGMAVSAFAVAAAGMAFSMAVVVAFHIRVKFKFAFEESLYCIICISADSSV